MNFDVVEREGEECVQQAIDQIGGEKGFRKSQEFAADDDDEDDYASLDIMRENDVGLMPSLKV